jgi:hypothetical protein
VAISTDNFNTIGIGPKNLLGLDPTLETALQTGAYVSISGLGNPLYDYDIKGGAFDTTCKMNTQDLLL